MDSFHTLYLALLAALALGIRAVEGTLVVQKSTSTIQSVLGCAESFICEGKGNVVEWRVRGLRGYNIPEDLITTVVNNAGTLVRSSLAFPNVTVTDGRSYTCTIRDRTASNSLSASLTVRETIVHIEPIEDIDISSKTVGETLSFECSVATCQDSIEIAILKGSQLITQQNFTDGSDTLVQVSLTITEDTADLYRCLVLLPDGSSFNETFRITGTPRRRPDIYHPSPGVEPGDPLPVVDETTKPSTTRRGSSSINAPQIQVIISLLVLFLVAVLTL